MSDLAYLASSRAFFTGFIVFLKKVKVELLKLGPGEGLGEIHAIEKSLDLNPGLRCGRQGALGSLRLFLELLDSPFVPRDILLVLALEHLDEVVHHPLVKIFAAKMGVAIRRCHLKHALLNSEHSDIEGAAAEVKDEDIALLLLFLVQPVSQCCGGGFVNHPEHLQRCNGTGVLGGCTLLVVEISRTGNHGIVHRSAEVAL